MLPRRPTALLSGFYHCPTPGPEWGYHQHGLYPASTHTGAVRHTVAPEILQRYLSSALAGYVQFHALTTV